MALIKAIPLERKGVTVSYWRISAANFRYTDQRIECSLSGYVSKDVRDDGINNHVCGKSLFFVGDDYKADMTRAEIYKAIKALPEFSAAEDA